MIAEVNMDSNSKMNGSQDSPTIEVLLTRILQRLFEKHLRTYRRFFLQMEKDSLQRKENGS